MKKKNINLTIIALLISSLAILNWTCKKDNPIGETITVKQYQVVSLNFTPGELTKQEYNAELGDYSLKLGKLNDTTLVMSVPLIEPDTYNLDIEDLGLYKNSFKVTETELSDTPENTLNSVSKGMSEYVVTLPDSVPEKQQIQIYIDAFNSQINTATAEEKEKVALFYQANKAVFDEILYEDYVNKNNKSGCFYCVSTSTKFKAAVLAMGAGVVLIWYPPYEVFETVAGIALVYIGYTKAKKYGQEITFKRLKFAGIIIGGNLGEKNINIISFVDGEQKELGFQTQNRGLTEADRNESSVEIPAFFFAFDSFNSAIEKINTVIAYANQNFPFTDINYMPRFGLESLSLITYSTPTDIFGNFSFKVANPRINLSKSMNTDGNILIKANVSGEFTFSDPAIETQMTVNYTDGFNKISSKFNITVNPKDTILSPPATDMYINR